MSLTIFCHFFNEELLLPFWLRHHVPLADHGVLVDDGSTDRSVEICRELAPGWEVVKSRRRDFDALELDREIEDLEAHFDGWKLALNVTEFLWRENPRDWLWEIEATFPQVSCLSLRSYVMVDLAPGGSLDARQLWVQRSGGYYPGRGESSGGRPMGLRFMHREKHGAYQLGRHGTAHPSMEAIGAALLWWGWSPWPQVKARKLQIQSRIPRSNVEKRWGVQHVVTEGELEERFAAEWRKAYLLPDGHQAYRDTLNAMGGPHAA